MAWTSTGVREADLSRDRLASVELEGRPVLLVNLRAAVHAVAGACPHLGGDLAGGTLTDGRIVCPLHGATYDLASGAVLVDPFGVDPPEGRTEPLARYRTRVVGGVIEVDLLDAPHP